MFRLRQFVPSRVCLKCEICCRFADAKGVWLPRLGSKETASLKRETIGVGKFKDGFCCEFFAPQKNRCRVYRRRPFDCRIYPFLLNRKKEKLSLAVHLACPFIAANLEGERLRRHVRYLKGFFRKKDIQSFLKRNPGIAQDYREFQNEVISLFTVIL